jgi:hypothetical protein
MQNAITLFAAWLSTHAERIPPSYHDLAKGLNGLPHDLCTKHKLKPLQRLLQARSPSAGHQAEFDTEFKLNVQEAISSLVSALDAAVTAGNKANVRVSCIADEYTRGQYDLAGMQCL